MSLYCAQLSVSDTQCRSIALRYGRAPNSGMTPMPRPTWSLVVSFFETASSCSQVVGMSASVSPALVHESVALRPLVVGYG